MITFSLRLCTNTSTRPPSSSKITTINNSPRTFFQTFQPGGLSEREEFMRNRNDERRKDEMRVVWSVERGLSLSIDKCFARCQFGPDLPPL